jgi:hypothetical protein
LKNILYSKYSNKATILSKWLENDVFPQFENKKSRTKIKTEREQLKMELVENKVVSKKTTVDGFTGYSMYHVYRWLGYKTDGYFTTWFDIFKVSRVGEADSVKRDGLEIIASEDYLVRFLDSIYQNDKSRTTTRRKAFLLLQYLKTQIKTEAKQQKGEKMDSDTLRKALKYVGKHRLDIDKNLIAMEDELMKQEIENALHQAKELDECFTEQQKEMLNLSSKYDDLIDELVSSGALVDLNDL